MAKERENNTNKVGLGGGIVSGFLPTNRHNNKPRCASRSFAFSYPKLMSNVSGNSFDNQPALSLENFQLPLHGDFFRELSSNQIFQTPINDLFSSLSNSKPALMFSSVEAHWANKMNLTIHLRVMWQWIMQSYRLGMCGYDNKGFLAEF